MVKISIKHSERFINIYCIVLQIRPNKNIHTYSNHKNTINRISGYIIRRTINVFLKRKHEIEKAKNTLKKGKMAPCGSENEKIYIYEELIEKKEARYK